MDGASRSAYFLTEVPYLLYMKLFMQCFHVKRLSQSCTISTKALTQAVQVISSSDFMV